MLVSGICIDAANAKLLEDGFDIKKTESGYELYYAVVNVGGKLHTYEAFMTGHFRSLLFPNNNIKKAELAFAESPRDAFLFVVKINFNGVVERFQALKGQFQIVQRLTFNDTEYCERSKLGSECMDLVANAGNHPFITRSTSLNQLTQNMTLFISLQLFDFMVKQLGISTIYTGVTAGKVIGDSKEVYRHDVGRLCALTAKHGVKIINGEGLLVRTQTRRDWVYSLSDVNTGSYTVSISSPFRDNDAILNQIILSAYIDQLPHAESKKTDMRIYGPSVKFRDHYLQMTNRSASFNRKMEDEGTKELSGRLLKEFVALLVDYNLDSQQMDLIADTAQTSINDLIVIASYYLAMNKPLPQKISTWMRTLCVEGTTITGTFLHVLSGMPFVHNSNTGGVISIDINNRLFEVDDCAGYKVRLLRKIFDGLSRNSIDIPSNLTSKIQLFEKLRVDPQIKQYISKQGL